MKDSFKLDILIDLFFLQLRCSSNPDNIEQFELAENKTDFNSAQGGQNVKKSSINHNKVLNLCNDCRCCSFCHCTCPVKCSISRWLLLIVGIIVLIGIIVVVVIYVKKGKELHTSTKPTGEYLTSLTVTTMVATSIITSSQRTTALSIDPTISFPILTTTTPSIPSHTTTPGKTVVTSRTTTTTSTEECKSNLKCKISFLLLFGLNCSLTL